MMDEPRWSIDPGSTPPVRHDAWFPPPLPPAAPAVAPAPSAPRRSGFGRRASVAALGAVLALLVGFTAGRLSTSASPSEVIARASQQSSNATQVAAGTTPLSGNEADPAASVAKVLAPAAVQLSGPSSLGSGFIYDERGLILTAAHVVEGNDTMEVRLNDGTLTTGTVVGANAETDIAVVRIDVDRPLTAAPLALGVKIEVGQIAVALGSPYGLDQTVTAGIVSAVNRAVPTTANGEVAMLQTDAPINPGNSGGMLANRYGQVIGVNDSIITGSSPSSSSESGNVGVGFAIPIDLAKSVADRLVAGQEIEFGYLGVATQDARDNRVGGLIAKVESGTPAAAAGLQEGDVVIKVDDDPVSGGSDLAAAIRARQPGDDVTLMILRDGQEKSLEVKVGKAPS